MLVVNFILRRQILLGMLTAACFFVPWNHRREHFGLRIGCGTLLLFVLMYAVSAPAVPYWVQLLTQASLLVLWVWRCFDCTIIDAVFYATCAYAVQHIASKLAYMIVVPLAQGSAGQNDFSLLCLLTATAAVCIPVYLRFTQHHIKGGRLEFDNAKTVLYSGLFLIAAVYLSVVLEDGFDQASSHYLTSYLALNAFCILLAITVLALEFSNCSIKHLENENKVLAQLLAYDKQQYEQAKRNVEKINIRYHDLKQQYNLAGEEERIRLEEEMQDLNLRYFTGNKALDITLTQKAGICARADIQLICSADGSCLARMKHYHIYSLIGNALDNAIECLVNVQDETKRVITLEISRCKDMAVIRVENYTLITPILQNGTPLTTKQDAAEHGYGIKSIRNIAETYGGTANCFVENEVFYLVVTFPYTVANSNVMNGISSTAKVVAVTPWWKITLIAVDTVLGAATILCAVMLFRKKKTPDETHT